MCARQLLLQYLQQSRPLFVDDAYYYLLIARNWLTKGPSTFNGIRMTNGYHPLWMGILVLQYKLLGQSLLLTRCLEFLFGATSIAASLLVFRLRGLLPNLLFTIGFFMLVGRIALDGMETSVLVCCFSLLAYSLTRSSDNPVQQGALDGILAALTIAARLDAAVFAIPYVLLATNSRARKTTALTVVAGLGLIYMAINHHYFGLSMPVSGEVKSLGGMQLNRTLLKRLENPRQIQTDFMYLMALGIPLGIALWPRTASATQRALIGAYIVGTVCFTIRLVFFSSWVMWPWYGYPLFIGYLACVPVLLQAMARRFGGLLSSPVTIATVTLLFVCASGLSLWRSIRHRHFGKENYFVLNTEVLATYGGLLNNSLVAMGDRAGNFAFAYGGGVEQIEGLVNDRAFLTLLRKRADIKPVLCERGVQYVVAYEPDLGRYQAFHVDVIRPMLSHHAVPPIEVSRRDEVVNFSDLSRFDGNDGTGYSHLYIWRLRCSK
ncbi:MAG: conserved rane protein of unknown function [Acidobacteriaceae bacterium]|nr:conserved rane protein of unknown function [Acidobacteriaceae bacterium]